jgi:hypothetical protein
MKGLDEAPRRGLLSLIALGLPFARCRIMLFGENVKVEVEARDTVPLERRSIYSH